MDTEAIRVVKLFPKFTPGSQQGKPVKVRFVLPFAFKLKSGIQSPDREFPKQKYIEGVYSKAQVSEMPEYPGGQGKMMEFLKNRIQYPQDALATSIEGTVVVSFVVNETGDLSDFAIAQDAYYSLNMEALRVVQMMPKFKPGLKDGKPVKVRFTLPVIFKLDPLSKIPLKMNTLIPMHTLKLDKYPAYLGGDTAEVRFMHINVRYPEIAREKGIQGRVVVGFTVNEDGTLSDFNIVKSVDKDLDAEAMRVVKLMPKFPPPMKDGKPVKAKFGFPISFKLAER